MAGYLGIVLGNSLVEPPTELPFVARRAIGDWDFLLVEVPEEEIDDHVASLQRAMVPGGPWYAHYFRGEEMVVVFADAVFAVSTDPSTWDDAVRHGLRRGIPREQLDFEPRTADGAAALFEGARRV